MLAVVASVIDHVRHTYHPLCSVLVKSPAGHWQPAPVRPGARTEEATPATRSPLGSPAIADRTACFHPGGIPGGLTTVTVMVTVVINLRIMTL